MIYIKEYRDYTEEVLIIVDVQKSFRKFFSEMYLNELNKYCLKFQSVYHLWDNHHVSKFDNSYLTEDQPETPITDELYYFPNTVETIEKRYNYNVNSKFYKKFLDEKTFTLISEKEKNGQLKRGDIFKTKNGTIITYIGNKHKWFHCPKKLYETLKSLKDKKIIIVGGSDSECLDDIFTTCESLSLKIKRDYKYIWSANHCPIK